MQQSILTTIVIFVLITLIPNVITSHLLSQEVYDVPESDEEFRVLWWFYSLGVILPVLGIFLVYGGISTSITYSLGWGEFLITAIGLGLLVLTTMTYYSLPRTRVAFREGYVIYHNGFKEKVRIRLDQIRAVRVFNGNILINDGNEHNKVIPIYFRNVSRLIVKLEQYRYNQD